MERVVKFDVICPTQRATLLRRQHQATLMNIRTQTHARVSINRAEDEEYKIITLSAVETLENDSPSSAALFEILPLIREFKLGNYEIHLLVEKAHRNCLNTDLLAEWMQRTLTAIVVYEYKKQILVKIVGGNHGIMNALTLIVTSLRKSFFQ